MSAASSAALALQSDADDVDRARRTLLARLGTAGEGWRGLAADAAADHGQELLARAAQVGEALTAGASVLHAYARQVEEAEELRRRASLLARSWQDAELLAAAERLRAEADAALELAARRASQALQELKPPAAPHRSQARGFASGLWGVLTDTARQGWYLDPHLIALHPQAWWSTVRDQATGFLAAGRHPRDALAAAVGLDQLHEHAYGEWAGTMLGTAVTGLGNGGTGRASSVARRLEREAVIVAEDGRWTVRRSSTIGGAVRPRQDAVLPTGFPTRIRDLARDRIHHILVGDGPGRGGHRSGIGDPHSTEFPPHWTDDDIIRHVMETAMHPQHVELRKGRFICSSQFDGVTVVVPVDAHGQIHSAWPAPGGRGVVDNKRSTS